MVIEIFFPEDQFKDENYLDQAKFFIDLHSSIERRFKDAYIEFKKKGHYLFPVNIFTFPWEKVNSSEIEKEVHDIITHITESHKKGNQLWKHTEKSYLV